MNVEKEVARDLRTAIDITARVVGAKANTIRAIGEVISGTTDEDTVGAATLVAATMNTLQQYRQNYDPRLCYRAELAEGGAE